LLVLALGVGVTGTVVALDEQDDSTQVSLASAAFKPSGAGDASDLAPVHDFLAGSAVGSTLEAFETPSPAPGTEPFVTMTNPTWEGRLLAVLVLETSPDGQWMNVRLPMRPNMTTGWVRASDLTTWSVPNRILISVTTNTLTVFRGDSDEVIYEAPVATGKPGTETPLGDFYIDIVNPLGHDPIYGWGQLSVSAFSHIWATFGGGIGQMAIHGWNNPSVVGHNVSNGCVRMRNEDIEYLATLAPLGTPVTVID
jgi:hypothetical protein